MRSGAGRSWEAGDEGTRSHGGGVTGGILPGETTRGDGDGFGGGEVGTLSSAPKTGDRMAKKEGEGVIGV